MKQRFVSTILIVLILITFFRPAEGEQLADLVAEALQNNPRIQAAERRWAAARARIGVSKAWPDLRLGIRFERNPGAVYSLGEARMRMFSLSQTFLFPGKLSLRGRVSESEAARAGWEVESVRREIIAKVKGACYELFVLQKTLRLLREQLDLLRAFQRTAEANFSVGRASQHDVLRAQVELALLRDELATLEDEDLITARLELNTLLDRPAGSPIALSGDLDPPRMTAAGERLEELAVERRPSLAAAEEMVAGARSAHDLARREYLPDLTVTVMEQRLETSMGEESTRGLRLSLALPLWFWGRRAGVSEKRALWAGARASYRDLENEVRFEVQQRRAEVHAAGRRVELYETAIVPLAEQSLKAARAAYEHREIDFLGLLSAERDLRDAKRNLYRALGVLGKSLARLERAVGSDLPEEGERLKNKGDDRTWDRRKRR